MRTVTYGAGCSLDGFIARPGGEVDWLHWSDDVKRLSEAYWSRVDTVLMGRKTYEAGKAHGAGAYPGVTNYVFSRSLNPAAEPKVTIIRENAANFVDELKRATGREICVMGGGELAQTLFDADLIDEVGVNVHPVLLGEGIPLFRRLARQMDLSLVKVEPLANDCLYALYRVLP
jgi:dihydrofolate reductase